MTTERERALGLLGDSANRVLRTVDGFHGDDWRAPSLLPGWTRAHVVAHLALNAEGLARGLRGVVADDPADEPRTMYDSDARRDSDIADLAVADPAEIRERLLAGTTILGEAIGSLPEEAWEQRVERTPGGREIRADAFPGMRLRELEIHHVDLDAGYTFDQVDPDLLALFLDDTVARLGADEDAPAMTITTDEGDRHVIGDGGVSVTGSRAGVLLWLARGRADGVRCDGDLPQLPFGG